MNGCKWAPALALDRWLAGRHMGADSGTLDTRMESLHPASDDRESTPDGAPIPGGSRTLSSPPPPPPEDLLARAACGDSDAFGQLVQPHLGLFSSGIRRVLGNAADSQDALQNALLAMFQDLPDFQGRSRFSSWGYKICINAALMFRRARGRFREETMDEYVGLGRFDPRGHHLEGRDGSEWAVEPEALAEAERRQLRECLMTALESLPEAQRLVFVLRDLEDYSTEEIAEQLEQTPATVRQRLHRARVTIQAQLKNHLEGRSR